MPAKATAPGKVILFGEHAVVYDKLGIAAAISRRCNVSVGKSDSSIVELSSSNYKSKIFCRVDELREICSKFERHKENVEFLKGIQGDKLLPPLLVASLTMKKIGKFAPLKIKISSKVPKNLGSSSSTFAAIAKGISKFFRKRLSKSELSNLVFQGDVVAHLSPSGIDNKVVVYGGFLAFKRSTGIRKLKIGKFPILVVDSGERARTSEMVSRVSRIVKRKKIFANKILEELDNISRDAVEALRNENFESVGNLMVNYYLELRKFGISTRKLDLIVRFSLKNGALGAKPTGGWGGGCCLVLGESLNHLKKLQKCFSKLELKSFITYLGEEGVK
ncbi:mevalonate kinase [Nanoarchaeota archaeon]|nr:MAG: mevalonate kinase [Nanoarchaeota archaeon]